VTPASPTDACGVRSFGYPSLAHGPTLAHGDRVADPACAAGPSPVSRIAPGPLQPSRSWPHPTSARVPGNSTTVASAMRPRVARRGARLRGLSANSATEQRSRNVDRQSRLGPFHTTVGDLAQRNPKPQGAIAPRVRGRCRNPSRCYSLIKRWIAAGALLEPTAAPIEGWR